MHILEAEVSPRPEVVDGSVAAKCTIPKIPVSESPLCGYVDHFRNQGEKQCDEIASVLSNGYCKAKEVVCLPYPMNGRLCTTTVQILAVSKPLTFTVERL